MPRHCLTGAELSASDVYAILDRAAALKAEPHASKVLDGKSVALIFEKPSTRTRVSFDVGEGLARVVAGGEHGHDRHCALAGELVEDRVGARADADRRYVPRQYARSVGGRLTAG